MWFGDFNLRVNVHVIDSARPQSLSTLFMGGLNADRIIVWDDGSTENLMDEKKAWEISEVRIMKSFVNIHYSNSSSSMKCQNQMTRMWRTVLTTSLRMTTVILMSPSALHHVNVGKKLQMALRSDAERTKMWVNTLIPPKFHA